MSQMGKYPPTGSGSPINTLTGNSGGPIGPDGAGNINILGAGAISVAGAGTTLTISLSGVVPEVFHTDAGDATPAANAITMHGGNNISTSGAGATVTYNVSGTTNHAVQIGNAGGSLTSLAALTNGQIVIGSTGANPIPASMTNGNNITWTGGAGTLRADVTGTTNHSLLLGNATGSINSLGAATNGQLPIGSTGADPVLATLTAGANVTVTNGAGSITIAANATSQTVNYTGVNHAASPYTVLAADYYISCDVTAGVISILLPNASATGRVFIVKDKVGLAATSNITITTVGGAVNIDGATTFVMNTAYQSVELIFNGVSYELF